MTAPHLFNERTLPSAEVRADWSETLGLARFANTFTIVEKYGKPIAVVAPPEVLPILERVDELLASGQCKSIDEVRSRLEAEGLLKNLPHP